MSYEIRPAKQADIEQLLQLSSCWQGEGCTRGYRAFGQGDDRPGKWLESGYLWVADLRGLVVGFVAGVTKLGRGSVFGSEGERFLHIHELYVDRAHRCQRVGHRLVEAMLHKAEAEGIRRTIVGSSNVDWLATYRFYERHGFQMLSMEMYRRT